MFYESKALHVYITNFVVDDKFLEKYNSFSKINCFSNWSRHYGIYKTLQSINRIISPAFLSTLLLATFDVLLLSNFWYIKA